MRYFVDKNFLCKNILVFCYTSPRTCFKRRWEIYFAGPVVFETVGIRIPRAVFGKFEAAILVGVPGEYIVVFIQRHAMNVLLWRMEEVMTNYVLPSPNIFDRLLNGLRDQSCFDCKIRFPIPSKSPARRQHVACYILGWNLYH